MAKDKIVLAYSGGLDTSVAVRWLQERYGVDVVTLTVDLGMVDLEEIRRRALDTGGAMEENPNCGWIALYQRLS